MAAWAAFRASAEMWPVTLHAQAGPQMVLACRPAWQAWTEMAPSTLHMQVGHPGMGFGVLWLRRLLLSCSNSCHSGMLRKCTLVVMDLEEQSPLWNLAC